MNEKDIYSKLKVIQQLYFLYLEFEIGCWKLKSSFEIWQFMMTHNLDRLNQRCHGLNAFDEFYSGLNGGWRGV